MPPRRRKNVKRQRRKRGKKRSGQASSGVPYRMMSTNQPFPTLYKTILRYQQTITLNPSAGAVAHAEFSTNGLYDPYLLAGGHQPRGRDELLDLYKKYHVIGSRITVVYSSVGTGATNDSVVVGISKRPLVYGGAGIDYNDYMEMGRSVWKTTAVGVSTPKLRLTWSPKKDEGVVDVLSHGAWGGAYNDASNPTNGAQYIVWVGAADQATDVNAWVCQVLIEYITVFTVPKHLVPS